jgi:GTP cyclohydrolase I
VQGSNLHKKPDYLWAFCAKPIDMAKIEKKTKNVSDKEKAVASMEEHYRAILETIGADLCAEGLREPPERAAKALWDMTEGARLDRKNVVKLFKSECKTVACHDLVMLSGIQTTSLCEHHILPIILRVSIGYMPDKKILGLSKMTRITHMFARQLQNQERIGNEIADFIEEVLKPRGVAVAIEGVRMCSVARGVRDMNSVMKTSTMRGVFTIEPDIRSEYLNLIAHQRNGGLL